MSKLQMSMLENALDFLEEASNRLLREPNQISKHAKYAILHLASGVELILKQKVYDNEGIEGIVVDNARNRRIGITEENLLAGELTTIYLDDAITNLIDNGILMDDEGQLDAVRQLKKFRNQIEHFQVDIKWQVSFHLMLGVWAFLVDFIGENLNLWEGEAEEIYKRVTDNMFRIEKFVEHRMAEIQPELERFEVENKKLLINCPECGKRALPLGIDNMVCVYCKTDFDSETVADKWRDKYIWRFLSPKERSMDYSFRICPDCGGESLFVNYDNNETIPADYFCFECGSHWSTGELDECMDCGELIYIPEHSPELTICDSCLDYRISSSD